MVIFRMVAPMVILRQAGLPIAGENVLREVSLRNAKITQPAVALDALVYDQVRIQGAQVAVVSRSILFGLPPPRAAPIRRIRPGFQALPRPIAWGKTVASPSRATPCRTSVPVLTRAVRAAERPVDPATTGRFFLRWSAAREDPARAPRGEKRDSGKGIRGMSWPDSIGFLPRRDQWIAGVSVYQHLP
jgi:hypothetical protein